jgi:hypothetical protein
MFSYSIFVKLMIKFCGLIHIPSSSTDGLFQQLFLPLLVLFIKAFRNSFFSLNFQILDFLSLNL